MRRKSYEQSQGNTQISRAVGEDEKAGLKSCRRI